MTKLTRDIPKEPEQEPVAWRLKNKDFDYQITSYDKEQADTDITSGWELVEVLYRFPPQSEQRSNEPLEPVAWLYKSEPYFDGNKWHDTFEVTTSKQVALWKDKSAKPLYTTPYVATPRPQPQSKARGLSQSKPLDMTEIVRLTYDIDEDKPATMAELFRFARAIEAAHGIKE